jgi:PmbA protein
MNVTNASEPDEANGISEDQESKDFVVGDSEPDLEEMYNRMEEYIKYSKENYPTLIHEMVIMDFTYKKSYFLNSNNVAFSSMKGMYNFSAMFTSKDKNGTSSFNYSGFSTRKLDKKMKDSGSVDTLLKQSVEQTITKPFTDKFVGDIIITPDCLGSFISYISSMISDYSLITKTSIFKDKLNKSIASSKLTLHSKPNSEEIIDGYSFLSDGYEAKNSTIIDKGVLKTFLLSRYGAKKTGLERSVNSGGCYVIENGDKTFEEMVKSVKKGILLARFSGGHPNENGDFSGVAKNSYYIEDGEIKYPISETMISGNLAEFLSNIKDISKESINYGSDILPWILAGGISISGK